MDAKKCDRCGKYYDGKGGYVVFYATFKVNRNFLPILQGEEYEQQDHRFDLCQDCNDSLWSFLTDHDGG